MKNIEYVIYCRKSTDETSEHQKQSIPDQIKACIEFAKRENLKIKEKPKDFSDFENEKEIFEENNTSDLQNRKIFLETRNLFIIKEQETAKIPYKRPKWRKLMKMIEKWKISWLISYSPDRQARNMLEWWELIDFVDKWNVNLKYTNFHFENNASWKMMLGIWFVFSKQYSDKLSEDVTRWNKNKISSWKAIWNTKHGYIINNEGYHEPDWKNFDLIKKAFEMKIDSIPESEILKNLEVNWYTKKVKKWWIKKWIWKNSLNKIFKDPFYYGILISWEFSVDLRETNKYFKPVISEENFQYLQEKFYKTKMTISETKDIYDEIKIFEKWFILAPDGAWLIFSLPNKNRFERKIEEAKKEWKNLTLKDVVKPNQIFYKCATKNSKYNKLSITVEEIDKVILKALGSFKVGEKEFKEYINFTNSRLDEIDRNNRQEITKINIEIWRIKNKRSEYIKNNMNLKKDALEEEIYEKTKNEFEEKIDFLYEQVKNLEKNERNEIVELEVFINLLNNAKEFYKKANYVQKGKIAKILFLNIKIDNKKSLKIQVKPVFQDLFIGNNLNWLRRQELNLWSSGYEPDEIPLLHSAI